MMTQHNFTAPQSQWRDLSAPMGSEPPSAMDNLASAPLPKPAYSIRRQDSELAAILSSTDKSASCADLLDSLEREFPEWFDAFAPADADLDALNDLAGLVTSAPHPFLAGLATGKLAERLSIMSITGRRPADFSGFSVDANVTSAMNALEGEHPEWFDAEARVEADLSASPDEMKALMNSAPHPYLAGSMYGRLAARVEIRALTGRPA